MIFLPGPSISKINVIDDNVPLFAVADLRGHPRHAPPTAQNFLNFMQFYWKIWLNCILAPPPRGSAPPPTATPGSAPDLQLQFCGICNIFTGMCQSFCLQWEGVSVWCHFLSGFLVPYSFWGNGDLCPGRPLSRNLCQGDPPIQ